MDFAALFETQRKFDAGFVDYEQRKRIQSKFLALIVEQGEAANECPETFKFWSSNPKGSSLKQAEKYAKLYNQPVIHPDKDYLLEELVDKLHFILSLGNELGLNEAVTYGFLTNGEIIDMQLYFTKSVTDLYFRWRMFGTVLTDDQMANEFYHLILGYFIGIAYELGYSSDSLEKAYYKKNQINYQRQEQGY